MYNASENDLILNTANYIDTMFFKLSVLELSWRVPFVNRRTAHVFGTDIADFLKSKKWKYAEWFTEESV